MTQIILLRDATPEQLRKAGLRYGQAEGAIPNKSRIVKSASGFGDAHKIGDKGVVLSSMGPIPFEGNPRVYGYWVEWDDTPGVPVFIAGTRIREVE